VELFDFFIKGNLSIEKGSSAPFQWISDAGWHDLGRLMVLDPVFSKLSEDVLSQPEVWQVCACAI
jgi:hypothetical protein